MIRGAQLIGRAETASGEATFAAVNPVSGNALAPAFHEATAADVDQALLLARRAAAAMGASSLSDRGALLDRVAESLEEGRESIVSRCQEETGYPMERVQGEFARMLGLWTTFANVVSALAAGCPVVVKGHPSHPGTSELLGRAIARESDC